MALAALGLTALAVVVLALHGIDGLMKNTQPGDDGTGRT